VTDDINGQAPTRAKNLRKGDRKKVGKITLRSWEVEFLAAYREFEGPLLATLPGGGKTISALAVAEEHLKSGDNKRVIIFVPTSHLRKQ